MSAQAIANYKAEYAKWTAFQNPQSELVFNSELIEEANDAITKAQVTCLESQLMRQLLKTDLKDKARGVGKYFGIYVDVKPRDLLQQFYVASQDAIAAYEG